MQKPSSYCAYVAQLPKDHVDRIYHDTQYGFPVECDNELFGRLILEINQAGLSWTTILNKQENFRVAFDNFDIKKIACYKKEKVDQLLNNKGIVRNKLKISAVVYNAKQVQTLQKEFGSFKKWLDTHHHQGLNEWIKLFKQTFKFTGGEITREFLTSTAYLDGAHVPSCPVYKKIFNQRIFKY